MGALSTPGTAAIVMGLETVPPAEAEPAHPAALKTASPDAAARKYRVRAARRLPFASSFPAGSSLMTLLARVGCRTSSGDPGGGTGRFPKHGRCGREYPIAARTPVKRHVTSVFPIRVCIDARYPVTG